MHYKRVYIDAIGFELPPIVVTSEELERRFETVYRKLRIEAGQLEALTGIRERRWWQPNTRICDGAARAARKALTQATMAAGDIEALLYGGVCREHYEPATACEISHRLGLNSSTAIYDVTNACLGVLNGIIDIANRIELGQIRAGLVVSSESAREITDAVIANVLKETSMDAYSLALATLTLGSGAIAVLLSDGSFPGGARHQLLGGAVRTAPEFFHLSRWSLEKRDDGSLVPFMTTDSVAVLKHGIELARKTWSDFRGELEWDTEQVDKVICHQVGSEHQKQVLKALGIAMEKDFSTFPYLGNVGTVSLPVTAAIADERGFLKKGDRVGFLGIGSGLNCMMLGLRW